MIFSNNTSNSTSPRNQNTSYKPTNMGAGANKTNNINEKAKMQTKSEGSSNLQNSSLPVLDRVKDELKNEGKTSLYAALLQAKGKELDDMTYGIGGINSFSKAIIESPDNMSELKRLVSIASGKDMRIKLVYGNEQNSNTKSNDNPIDIGINIA